MKRILCFVLALCVLFACVPALALTGDEALGLVGSGSSGSSGSSAGYPTLKLGSKDGDDAGAYVVKLQNRLAELGYLASASDGTYGAMTETAVINFQETNYLTPNGIADSTTQTMLYSDSAQKAVIRTDANSDLMRVQQALTRWGFMYGAVDGVSGTNTETGVAEFKSYLSRIPEYKDYANNTDTVVAATLAPGEQPIVQDVPIVSGISVNGYSGEITDNVLRFVDEEYPFEVYRKTVRRGDDGVEVWRVQRRLRQLKYLYKPDGDFGSVSENALKYFQRKNDLDETGVADEETQVKLFSADAVQSDEYIFPYKIKVNTSKQRVYVYGWDGSGYNKKVSNFKCSTGRPGYETPKGTYQSGGRCTRDEWYYFKSYGVYAKYATRIVGGVLFHSVLYNKNKKGPTKSSVNNLGKPVSHGCVRLAVKNAKWIFKNCAEGTTVEIY